MRITRAQFETLEAIKTVRPATLSEEDKETAAAKALTILDRLHVITHIGEKTAAEMYMAIKIVRDQAERVLRETGTPIPAYTQHPIFAKKLLDADLSFLGASEGENDAPEVAEVKTSETVQASLAKIAKLGKR